MVPLEGFHATSMNGSLVSVELSWDVHGGSLGLNGASMGLPWEHATSMVANMPGAFAPPTLYSCQLLIVAHQSRAVAPALAACRFFLIVLAVRFSTELNAYSKKVLPDYH